MNLENRYLVIKRADIEKYLGFGAQEMLAGVANTIEDARQADKRSPLECVVIESDWPEYEPTISALETRIDTETAAEVDNKHYCDAGKWWEITEAPKGSYCVTIGMHDILLESDVFTYRGAAYKQKNKWMTKHNMFCPDN